MTQAFIFAPRKLKKLRKSNRDISMGSYIIFIGMSAGLLAGVSFIVLQNISLYIFWIPIFWRSERQDYSNKS
jgi:hypothetical protein